MIREAMFFSLLEGGRVKCRLCPHQCVIAPGKFGICGVRQNRERRLVTHVYGRVIAAHVDPIEKKPLFHFLPGTRAFSIATIGCNFQCPFCQNWQISQASKTGLPQIPGEKLEPEEVVSAAWRSQSQSISYTYTEPTIFFEYAYDTARLATAKGLRNNFVTNGYISAEALEEISPYLDAANIDLKSFREEFYRKFCKAHLQPVLETITRMRKLGIWVEVTTLVISGENDTPEELRDIACFLKSVDPNIPWHISRFHPDYKLTDREATPLSTLRRAYEIGRTEGLQYVYLGNVLGEEEDTYCPACERVVIRRFGFFNVELHLDGDRCRYCGQEIAGVFG